MRVIYEFGKKGRLRFISHLDLQRFMMRALRRTDLPVSWSQGFNPHPHLSFASALAMGWSSTCELMDIRLSQSVDEKHALTEMQSALPPDLPVYRCRLVDDKHPALMANLVMADYDISIQGNDAGRILNGIDGFMSESVVMAKRKTKSAERDINIRPLTKAISVSGEIISARLMLTPEETLKPDLLLEILAQRTEAADYSLFIERKALLGKRTDGSISGLMELDV